MHNCAYNRSTLLFVSRLSTLRTCKTSNIYCIGRWHKIWKWWENMSVTFSGIC